MSRRNRSAVDILEDHERAIKRLEQALVRIEADTNFYYRETVIFTSDDTFTKADYPWLTRVRVKVAGGGGGGGGAKATSTSEFSLGGGGGAGGYAETTIEVASLGTTETVTVGAGGGVGAGSNGGIGLETSFGAHAVGKPGRGGTAHPTANTVGLVRFGWGGDASDAGTGDIVIQGGAGETGIASERFGSTQRAGRGGGNPLSGAVHPESQTHGVAGLPYGGGGSGGANPASQTAKSGGVGASGVVIVELFG